MPEQVKAKWDGFGGAVNVRRSECWNCAKACKVASSAFRRLHINGTEGEAGVLLVHPSVKDSLVSLLTSLLGDRFNDRT